MARSLLIFIMVAALILPFATTVTAQPDPQFGNWELGIEYPQEDRDNPFILSEGGMTSVTFFVDNMGLLDIKVSFEYDIPFNGQFSGPEDASVSAGNNDSFMMLITGIDVYQHSAGSKEAFTISANLEERAGLPIIIPESQERNGDLEIPEIHELHVDITDAVGPINAGTDSILRVTVTNRGNTQDRVREVEVSDDCPLLTTDDGLEVLTSRNLNAGASTTADLNVMASESHPKRNCRIEVTVASEGADGAQLSTDFTRIDIDPPPSQPDDPADTSDPTDPIEVVTSNLPAPGLSIVFSILIGALIASRSRRF